MSKKNGGRGGGRGGGGGRGRGRGRGRGSFGIGFAPFAGPGHLLDNTLLSSPTSNTNSPRGGNPFAGRGGQLSAQGQNRVDFDYSSLVRSSAPNIQGNNNNEHANGDGGNVSIEPPKGYKHKHKPHLELPSHPSSSNPPNIKSPNPLPTSFTDPAIPTGPRAGLVASPSKNNFAKFQPKSAAKARFPEFFTSRGAGGKYSRPPEEDENAKYLAGVSGFRSRSSQNDRKRPARSGEPFDSKPNMYRVPVAFVKASGEWKNGKLVPFRLEEEEHGSGMAKAKDANANHAEEIVQQQDSIKVFGGNLFQGQQHTFDFSVNRPKHGGIGFSRPNQQLEEKQQQQSHVFSMPSMDLDMQDQEGKDDQDEVAALLKAFPGSRELAPGESLVGDVFHGILPQLAPLQVKPAISTPSAQPIVAEEECDDSSSSSSSSDEDEIILVPSLHASTSSATGFLPNQPLQCVESDSEEERQIDAILAQTCADNLDLHNEKGGSDIHSDGGAGLFVIDLTGGSPQEGAMVPSYDIPSTDRLALGDAAMTVKLGKEASVGKISKSQRKADKRLARNARPVHGHRRGEMLIPREGDSDLDWGSDGPPDIDGQDDVSMMDADMYTNDGHETFISITGSQRGNKRKNKKKPIVHSGGRQSNIAQRAQARAEVRSKRSHEADIIADYMENIMNQNEDDSDEQADGLFEGDIVEETMDGTLNKGKGKGKDLDQKTDLDAMIRFINGMDPQKGGREMSFGDVADEAALAEEDEWMTEESDSEEEEEDNDIDIDNVIEMPPSGTRKAKSRAKRLSKKDVFEQSEADLFDREANDDSEDEALAEKLRKILASEDSDLDDLQEDVDDDDDSEDDDDDDEKMFRGKYSWADKDEAFIAQLNQTAGNGQKVGKKVFHAISTGDFSELLDENLDVDLDDQSYGGAIPTAKRGKQKGKTWKVSDLWAEDLQKQWQKDRASKAEKKRLRMLERQTAALNPFPNTHGKGISKKVEKRTKREAKREARAKLKAGGWKDGLDDDDDDEEEEELFSFGGIGNGRNGRNSVIDSIDLSSRFAYNLTELDEQIRLFLKDTGKTTLSLPPMDKRARAQVHMLASAYSIKSKSMGKGKQRFPTLIKTRQSGVLVDERRVRQILSTHHGTGSFGANGKKKGNKQGGGSNSAFNTARNKNGQEVGFGAEKIGADNIGHKLLSAMGWTEGSGIGVMGGIANPVSATVKVTRGGLGW